MLCRNRKNIRNDGVGELQFKPGRSEKVSLIEQVTSGQTLAGGCGQAMLISGRRALQAEAAANAVATR